MRNEQMDRLKKLADLEKELEDLATEALKGVEQGDSKSIIPEAKPVEQKPAQFNIQSATTYNTKSEQYFKNNEAEIKRILGTQADWKSPEFAQAVYDWQNKNGFSGKWLDGKLGPRTIAKMAETDSNLKYDAYEQLKVKHVGEAPYPRVMKLKDQVVAVQQKMGATDIPLEMLLGWIQVESGGKVGDITNVAGGPGAEMGLFQVSENEAKAIGADPQRLTTDTDYSIEQGIKLARYHEQNLAPYITKYYPKGSEMYWRLVFQGFVAGDGFTRQLIQQMTADGNVPQNWDEVMKFAQSVQWIAKHSAPKWTYHVDRAFNLGKQMVGSSAVASKIEERIKKAKTNARRIVLGGW